MKTDFCTCSTRTNKLIDEFIDFIIQMFNLLNTQIQIIFNIGALD